MQTPPKTVLKHLLPRSKAEVNEVIKIHSIICFRSLTPALATPVISQVRLWSLSLRIKMKGRCDTLYCLRIDTLAMNGLECEPMVKLRSKYRDSCAGEG